MVEETKEPERIFPRMMLTGLGIAVIIYMLVAVSVVTVLTSRARSPTPPEGRALLEVVRIGAPDFPIDKIFPFLAVFAVANTALINMLMASRLIYGMANQDVLPRTPRQGARRTRRAPYAGDHLLHAAGARADHLRRPRQGRVRASSSTCPASPSLLLLVRLHDRQHRLPGAAPRRPASTSTFRSPDLTPVPRRARLPLPGRPVGRTGALIQYQIAGILIADRRRALGDHLDRPTAASAPRRPGSATSTTSSRHRLRDLRTIAGPERRARTLDG